MVQGLICGLVLGKFEAGYNWALFHGAKLSTLKTAFLKAAVAHALMVHLFSILPTATPWTFSHALMAALIGSCFPLRSLHALMPTMPQVPLNVSLTSETFGV
jgi:hypothetical protein